MTPEERLAAKRANEGTRALATFLNNLAVGTVVAGFLTPLVAGRPEPWWVAAGLILIAAGLHLCVQVLLRRFLEPEE